MRGVYNPGWVETLTSNYNHPMKKAIVLSLIGLAASVATTFGEIGQLVFETYASSTPTTYVNLDNGATIFPFPAGAGITAALLYSFTPLSQAAGYDLPVAGFSPAYQMPDAANPANGLMTALFFTALDDGEGYFVGSGNNADFELQSYTPGTPVYFEVIAYDGSSYNTSSSRGHSAVWAQTLKVAPDAPVDIAVPAFSVYGFIPEPATLTLGGLGLAALLFFRRKQA